MLCLCEDARWRIGPIHHQRLTHQPEGLPSELDPDVLRGGGRVRPRHTPPSELCQLSGALPESLARLHTDTGANGV